MSWDIHGNPLKNGYCEVHPWVAEYYPCSLCDVENIRMNRIDSEMRDAEIAFVRSQEKEKLINEAIAIAENMPSSEKNVLITILNTLRNY